MFPLKNSFIFVLFVPSWSWRERAFVGKKSIPMYMDELIKIIVDVWKGKQREL